MSVTNVEDRKYKPIYVKHAANKNALRKHYLGITLIQKL